MNARISLLLLAAVLTAAVGCSDNSLPGLKGQVLVNGQPAPEGISLVFEPHIDGDSPSYANTDKNGEFVAEFTFNKKGILVGTHSVRLGPGSSPGPMPVIDENGRPVPGSEPKPQQFPPEYYRHIQDVTVEPGSNTVTIELKTK